MSHDVEKEFLWPIIRIVSLVENAIIPNLKRKILKNLNQNNFYNNFLYTLLKEV